MAKKKTSTKKKTGPKGPQKRPKTAQDFEDFEELCRMQCTSNEICGFFRINTDTLAKKIENHYKTNASEKIKELRASGLATLRRLLWDKAKAGDGHTQRWLSRQYLGMTDKVEIDEKKLVDSKSGEVLPPAERLKLIHGSKA